MRRKEECKVVNEEKRRLRKRVYEERKANDNDADERRMDGEKREEGNTKKTWKSECKNVDTGKRKRGAEGRMKEWMVTVRNEKERGRRVETMR